MSTVVSNDQARKNIARNLQRLLRDRGWEQKELAKRTGESKMTISRTVRGINLPNSGVLARIAEALDVSVDRLLAEPPPEPSANAAGALR